MDALNDHRGQHGHDLTIGARRFSEPGSPVDNVTRKIAYEDQRPDVRFVPPCVHDGLWTAVLEGGAVEIRAVDLALLLDELEKRDRDRPGGPT